MIKVFIVDDHELIREGLKKILCEELDIKVVGEAKNGTDVLRSILDIDCDILLLDLMIPGRNGVSLIEDLKKKKPSLHILILSIHPEQKYALPALKAGASGYLSKDIALTEMVAAIHKIYTHGRYLSSTLAEVLAFNLMQPEVPAKRKLSSMESNIAVLISKGESAKSVANGLDLSVSTVFTYRRKIFEKLRIKSNVELAHYVVEHELTSF